MEYFNVPKSLESIEYTTNNYIDLGQFNIKDTISKEYNHRPSPIFHYFEAKLSYLNIENKNDYLNILQIFNDLLNVLLAELLSNPELIKETVTGEGKHHIMLI
jgi:hypothetical protein